MELAVPIVPADDLDLAKSFYLDKLGFNLNYQVPYADESWILSISRGTIKLTIDIPMSGHGKQICVSLEVLNVDSYFNEWSQKIKINEAPINQDWGERTFEFQDPFENTIFVIGPVD